jgi:hypothetical protein
MTWKPSDDVDQSVREWMKTRGWEVTRTHYDSKRKVYAWRYGVRSGPSPTLGQAHRGSPATNPGKAGRGHAASDGVGGMSRVFPPVIPKSELAV